MVHNSNLECFVDTHGSNSSAVFGKSFMMSSEKDDGEKFSNLSSGKKYTLLAAQQVILHQECG